MEEERREERIETNAAGGQQSDIGVRLDLIDGEALHRLGRMLRLGADKYDATENWRRVAARDHVNHALNHLCWWLAELRSEPGSSEEDHLGHAFCRLMMACATDGQVQEAQWAPWPAIKAAMDQATPDEAREIFRMMAERRREFDTDQ